MQPMEPLEVVSGPRRLSQAQKTRNNYDFRKFFLYFPQSPDWLIGLHARVLLEPPAGGRNIPQMLSSLIDTEFCCPICISHPSTKLPTGRNVSGNQYLKLICIYQYHHCDMASSAELLLQVGRSKKQAKNNNILQKVVLKNINMLSLVKVYWLVVNTSPRLVWLIHVDTPSLQTLCKNEKTSYGKPSPRKVETQVKELSIW